MIKVAIIDSGIKKDSTIHKNYVKEGIGFNYDKGIVIQDNNYEDINGHGYYCSQIILSQCLDIELYILRILDKNNQGDSKCLIEALTYLLEHNVNIINLSLAVFSYKHNRDIEMLCTKLKEKGSIIVASLANHKETSFPASSENVLGVKGEIEIDMGEYRYYPENSIQCMANSSPVLVNDLFGGYTFFGGNSKAAALLTGILAKYLCQMPDTKLEELLILNSSDEIKKNGEKNKTKKVTKEKLKIIVDTITRLWNLNESQKKLLFTEPLYSTQFSVLPESYGKLISELEKDNKNNIQTKIGETSFDIFNSIYTLYDFVEGVYNDEK